MLATPTPAATLSVAQVLAEVDRLHAEYPHAGTRALRAGFLALFGHVERGATPHLWWVDGETDPTRQYLVCRRPDSPSSCSCEDWKRRHAESGSCKHILAVLLAERLERLEADAGTPPEPEPPASSAPIPYALTDQGQAVVDAYRAARAAAIA